MVIFNSYVSLPEGNEATTKGHFATGENRHAIFICLDRLEGLGEFGMKNLPCSDVHTVLQPCNQPEEPAIVRIAGRSPQKNAGWYHNLLFVKSVKIPYLVGCRQFVFIKIPVNSCLLLFKLPLMGDVRELRSNQWHWQLSWKDRTIKWRFLGTLW